jgi:hypothetical protein
MSGDLLRISLSGDSVAVPSKLKVIHSVIAPPGVTEASCYCAHPEITISKFVKKVRTHSMLIGRKPLKRNRVLTEEKLDDIDHQLENSKDLCGD